MTAATALALDYSTREALQRHTHHHLTGNVTQFSHSVISLPSSHAEHVMREHPMSSDDSTRTLGKRISDALWRRINAGAITRKHLRDALGCSLGTVDNLLSGYNDPSGRILMALLTFFDESFANEILAPTGCTVAKLSDRRAAALQKIAAGMAELKSLEG